MAKVWYLVKAVKEPFDVEYIKTRTLKYKKLLRNKKIDDTVLELYEWFSEGQQFLSHDFLNKTYYQHEIVDYQDWVPDAAGLLSPKIRFFRASKGLSFIIQDLMDLGVFYPHPFNFLDFNHNELVKYISRISEIIWDDPDNLKLIQYDVSKLNKVYSEKQIALSFTRRKGGVNSGTIYGKHMQGDHIYEEAKKGLESYSVYEFDVLHQKYKIGVSIKGSIVTFEKIEGKEYAVLSEVYKYLKIGEIIGS